MAPPTIGRAAIISTGSPKSTRNPTPTFKVLDEHNDVGQTPIVLPREIMDNKFSTIKRINPLPLQSDTRSNLQGMTNSTNTATTMEQPTSVEGVCDILARLHANDAHKAPLVPVSSSGRKANEEALDKLLSNLHIQNNALKQQERDLHTTIIESFRDKEHLSGSELPTPATDTFGTDSSQTSRDSDTVHIDHAEMLRVRKELEAARSVISRQEQELAQTRNFKHSMEQSNGPAFELDYGKHNEMTEKTIGHLQSAFNASARPFTLAGDAWTYPSEARFSRSEATHPAWNVPVASSAISGLPPGHSNNAFGSTREVRPVAAINASIYPSQLPPIGSGYAPVRNFSNSSLASLGPEVRLPNDPSQYYATTVSKRNGGQFRSSTTYSDPISQYSSYSTGHTSMSSPIIDPVPFRPVGQTISPTVSEFPGVTISDLNNPWPLPIGSVNNQTYVTPLEPMNYRRLLDKSVSCDWKYIVDKIVCNNDQQASIFLQQKLKVGTAEQKFEIVEAIINQAYPLMINRFGNFLVQRCFEHGTPDQVIAIADAIQGNVLALSTDPFGCHVIQKAFDSVPESHKADMVRELLRRIPETVIHRYACHVWQKLFELRWSGEPPQIMVKVNEALCGMWHEVAMGETGSLVVQNIFENCVEEEKRPAIEEVIANIDLIAHGQFGNWCIQHLCEHGSPPDKRRVIDHILTNSYNYSIDQFASKVVEKCLKIGGSEFLDLYLGVITTAHPERPRIPLIDIAGDQYGNYLIQWILMNTHPQQRDQVIMHIRKHMVSLRGSKFGSRVAMLCCNPGAATRPVPAGLVAPNPFGAPGQARTTYSRYR